MDQPAFPDLAKTCLSTTLYLQNPRLFDSGDPKADDRLLARLLQQPEPPVNALNRALDRLTVADQALYRTWAQHTFRPPGRGKSPGSRLLPLELYPALQPKIQQGLEARRQAQQELLTALAAALPRHPEDAAQFRERSKTESVTQWQLAPAPSFPELLQQDFLGRNFFQFLPLLGKLYRRRRQRAYCKAETRRQELLARHQRRGWIPSGRPNPGRPPAPDQPDRNQRPKKDKIPS